MSDKETLSKDQISEIVRGLDPVDWLQVELLAKLPPGKRIIPPLQAQEFSMAGLRGAFRRRFPELSISEINMMVLSYLPPVRMKSE